MHYLDIFILQNLAYMFRPIMAIIRALHIRIPRFLQIVNIHITQSVLV